jgi:hypothetical protein
MGDSGDIHDAPKVANSRVPVNARSVAIQAKKTE